MKFINDRALKDMNVYQWQAFGKNGLQERVKDLEERIKALETKPKMGRPRKVDATND
jgi:hypothetical protein